MVVTIPSNPLPHCRGSIYDHVATGLRIRRWSRPVAMADRVEQALEAVDLWEELGPRLSEPAASVCPAQIPRLALASALAVSPPHILWAEPGGGLDPVETDLLDKALRRASSKCTVIIATNQVRQLARLTDVTIFVHRGQVVEISPTAQVLERPANSATERFITEHYND